MMLNLELLNATHKHIKTKPELHDQRRWAEGVIEVSGSEFLDQNICGTTACFAGWAALIGGWHQVRPYNVDSCDCDECYNLKYDSVVDETGREKEMEDAARETLGLSVSQAAHLFFGENRIEEIDAMVDALNINPGADLSAISSMRRVYGYIPAHYSY